MIEINLLPDEFKKKEAAFRKFDLTHLDLKGRPVVKIALGVIAILAVVHGLLFSLATYCNMNLKELSKKQRELLPNIKEAQVLKDRSQVMIRKVGAINELMVKRFSWAKKLDALSDSMTPGIWLTEISYDEREGQKTVAHLGGAMAGPGLKGRQDIAAGAGEVNVLMRYLVMSGCASSPGEEGAAVVGKFIKSLKENGNFYSDIADIELGSIKSDKLEDQEVNRFRIICTFK